MNNSDFLTDQQLASLLRKGDADAFKQLYDRFWSKMLVVAAKRLDDVAEAEEAVQDIFVNLWRKRETFELKVSFEHYLAVAVKFEIINRRAKWARKEALHNSVNVADAVYDGGADLELKDLLQQLERTINSLPPKCRLVFRLSRDDEFTNRQIAEELGVSEKAVEKHISKALKVLREKFGRKYCLVVPYLGING